MSAGCPLFVEHDGQRLQVIFDDDKLIARAKDAVARNVVSLPGCGRGRPARHP
jgi:hypothetical protein